MTPTHRRPPAAQIQIGLKQKEIYWIVKWKIPEVGVASDKFDLMSQQCHQGSGFW